MGQFSVRLLLHVTLLLLIQLGEFTGSWTLADEARLNSPTSPSTPDHSTHQWQGLNRVGNVVALILACIIVPAGVIAITYLLIVCCLAKWRGSRGGQSQPTTDEDGPQNWSDMSDSDDDYEKEVSTLYMYINPTTENLKRDQNVNLVVSESNI